MANKDKSPAKNKRSLSIKRLFERFHAVMFFVVVFGGLAVAVYMLSTIISNSSTPAGYTPPSTESSFDTETIDRVDQLRPLSTPPSAFDLPQNERSDPFAS